MKAIKAVAALAVIAVAILGLTVFTLPNSKVQPSGVVSVEIPRGTGTRRMAELLAAKGVIASPLHFLAARALRPSARLQAGLYDFSQPASAAEVYDRIVRGDVHLYELTVPEGSNIWEVSEIAASLGWFSAADFLAATRDRELVRELLPELQPPPESLEGYLFPSTYRLALNMTPRQIIAQMTGEFHKVWKRLDPKMPMAEAVTLASLVEKETGLADERTIVASVYRNRLRNGMLLGCDPTVIYGALLRGRYRGTIYRSDLDDDNAYNTYRRAGLPPGPIANPGEASLKAALMPAETKFIYFVARGDGSGGHVFTENAVQHNRAVAQYRRAVAQNR